MGKVLLSLWFVLLLGAKVWAAYADYGKDTSTLVDTIRTQVHERVDEVVFVDETALYGVRVYLGTPVLRVDYGDTPKPQVDDTLAGALAQHRPHRLWLVHQHTASQFVGEVARSGMIARAVAHFAHYQAFVIDDPKAAMPAPAPH